MIAGYVPNKFPGACFYCSKRVAKGVGSLWKGVDGFHVAHGECLVAAHAQGKEPDKVDRSSQAAHVLREVREVLRSIRVDAPTEDIMRALGRVGQAVERLRENVADVLVVPSRDEGAAAYVAAGLGEDVVPF